MPAARGEAECQPIKAGLPGLHIQLTSYGAKHLNLSGVDAGATATPNEAVNQLGFDSQSHYLFVTFTNIDGDSADLQAEYRLMDGNYDIPYFPHVSLGWDNNPRHQDFRPGITPKITTDQVAKALVMARDYADAHPGQAPLITINSWNEWSEGSYRQLPAARRSARVRVSGGGEVGIRPMMGLSGRGSAASPRGRLNRGAAPA